MKAAWRSSGIELTSAKRIKELENATKKAAKAIVRLAFSAALAPTNDESLRATEEAHSIGLIGVDGYMEEEKQRAFVVLGELFETTEAVVSAAKVIDIPFLREFHSVVQPQEDGEPPINDVVVIEEVIDFLFPPAVGVGEKTMQARWAILKPLAARRSKRLLRELLDVSAALFAQSNLRAIVKAALDEPLLAGVTIDIALDESTLPELVNRTIKATLFRQIERNMFALVEERAIDKIALRIGKTVARALAIQAV